jgi:uncharacterized protein
MAREMTPDEIEQFIAAETVARIGCHAGDETYVVPVAYAKSRDAIYAFSHEGRKLQMMRENPSVCVEFDAVSHLGSWRSVIAWGTFEELRGHDAELGTTILHERLASLATDPESRRRLDEALGKEPQPVVYRIVIERATGRVEGQ